MVIAQWLGRGGVGVLVGNGGARGGRGAFGHGVHLMPPCFDFLRMRGIINEKSKKFIKISIISYTKMMSQVFLVKSEKKISLCWTMLF